MGNIKNLETNWLISRSTGTKEGEGVRDGVRDDVRDGVRDGDEEALPVRLALRVGFSKAENKSLEVLEEGKREEFVGCFELLMEFLVISGVESGVLGKS